MLKSKFLKIASSFFCILAHRSRTRSQFQKGVTAYIHINHMYYKLHWLQASCRATNYHFIMVAVFRPSINFSLKKTKSFGAYWSGPRLSHFLHDSDLQTLLGLGWEVGLLLGSKLVAADQKSRGPKRPSSKQNIHQFFCRRQKSQAF